MRTPRWCVLWPIGLTAFPTIVSGHAVDQTPPQKPVADPVFEAQLPALDTVPAPATAAPPPPPPPPLVPDRDIAQPAFVFGVLPLAISTGPGSGGRHAIGRAVVGGMLSATVLAIFFVPVFFVLVKTLFKRAAPADDDGNDAVSSDPAQEA